MKLELRGLSDVAARRGPTPLLLACRRMNLSTAASDPKRRRLSLVLLLVFCAAYLLLRGIVLWFAFDAVALPIYEVHNMGNLARVLASGAPGPPLWQHYDNAGGQQLVALLAAPLYALFGDSYLVLKLVPMLLGLAALVLLWRLMAREFGLLGASVAAALFVVGPPTLTKYSLLASGNHFEHVFCALLLYTAFAAVHRDGRRGPRLAALGAAAGCSLWVYPGAVVTVIVFATVHVVLRGLRGTLQDLPLAIAGFLLGLMPLIVTNIAVGGRSLDYTSHSLAGKGDGVLPRLGRNLATMLGDLLPRAGAYETLGRLPALWAEHLELTAFVVAWLLVSFALLRARGRDWSVWRVAPLLLYLPVFLLVIGLGNWDFDAYGHPLEVGQFRYFVTHFAFAAMLIGAAVSMLAARGGAGRLAAGALAGVALLPCLDTLPIATPWPGTAGAGLRYEGHHFPYYGLVMMAHASRDPATGGMVPDDAEITHWLRGLPPRHALDAWSGVAYYVAETRVESRGAAAIKTGELIDLGTLLEARPPAVQYAFARGLGSALRALARGAPAEREVLRTLLLRLERRNHPLAPALIEGMCLDQDYTLARDTADRLEMSFALADVVPPGLLFAYRRGLGVQLGRLLARGVPADVERVRNVLARLPGAIRADVAFGLGWGFSEIEPAARLSAALADVGQSALLIDTLHGAGACRHHFEQAAADGALSADDTYERDDAALDAASRAALEAGRSWPNYPGAWTFP